jgi:hypothetical protein
MLAESTTWLVVDTGRRHVSVKPESIPADLVAAAHDRGRPQAIPLLRVRDLPREAWHIWRPDGSAPAAEPLTSSGIVALGPLTNPASLGPGAWRPAAS